MSRKKNAASKQINPLNPPLRNIQLARFGEFADSPEAALAFGWKCRSALIAWCMKQPKKKAAGRKLQVALDAEIAAAMRDANARGDWRFLEALAKATEFLSTRCDWNALSKRQITDLITMRSMDAVDPLRSVIALEYFCTRNALVDSAKKRRKTFMAHVAKKMRAKDDHSERGSFSKTFDRACSALGIRWR